MRPQKFYVSVLLALALSASALAASKIISSSLMGEWKEKTEHASGSIAT